MAAKKKSKKIVSKKASTVKKTRKTRKRYSNEQKTKLLVKYEELCKEMTTQAASKKLGISYMRLRNGKNKSGKKPVKREIKTTVRKTVKVKMTPIKKVGSVRFSLKISGPDTQIERSISEAVVSQIVKLVF